MTESQPGTETPKTPRKPRRLVELTAYWGNDDAESTIKISPRMWSEIQAGKTHFKDAYGWYEGRRFRVGWTFIRKTVTIEDASGDRCVDGRPIEELIVRLLPESPKSDAWTGA